MREAVGMPARGSLATCAHKPAQPSTSGTSTINTASSRHLSSCLLKSHSEPLCLIGMASRMGACKF